MRFFIQSSLIAFLALTGPGCAMFYAVPSSPIHEAAWKGDIARVEQLVNDGADVNAPDALGATPLYLAAQGGHPFGPHRCGNEDPRRPEVIRALIDLGADLNAPDRRPRTIGASSGWTPLMIALHHKQFKSAETLLKAGANPNIRSDQGMSVMEMASAEGAPRELIELIVAKGFDPQSGIIAP
jgi:ankyrin repeat protein